MPAGRSPLNRTRVVGAAVQLADASGMAAVTMRATAAALGVEAMSLYHHVANRADLVDGMVDAVFAEIELPDGGGNWRDHLRRLAVSARRALQRHPWATGLLDSRSKPGPATLRHHDSVLGILRRSGFSPTMAIHALSVVDSYLYGNVLQERSLPLDELRGQEPAAAQLLESLPGNEYPYLAEIAAGRAGPDPAPGPDDEFAFGLDLILGALTPDDPAA
ncbi:TetR/AcrR family transcriptional regulator [Amycolatopsis jejuensis]|uniref:TetR/AcrR family transcriptional regulator n=1 Tax=Amycolatopsis jejuensis TaxID=330084 RepID=UPI000525ED82|nr:TetR/AcrR family transcriptional regulator [Amycolatopsis jejuensis]